MEVYAEIVRTLASSPDADDEAVAQEVELRGGPVVSAEEVAVVKCRTDWRPAPPVLPEPVSDEEVDRRRRRRADDESPPARRPRLSQREAAEEGSAYELTIAVGETLKTYKEAAVAFVIGRYDRSKKKGDKKGDKKLIGQIAHDARHQKGLQLMVADVNAILSHLRDFTPSSQASSGALSQPSAPAPEGTPSRIKAFVSERLAKTKAALRLKWSTPPSSGEKGKQGGGERARQRDPRRVSRELLPQSGIDSEGSEQSQG